MKNEGEASAEVEKKNKEKTVFAAMDLIFASRQACLQKNTKDKKRRILGLLRGWVSLARLTEGLM